MNKGQFRDILVGIHTKMVNLTESKGEEYARSDDQLANFKRQAAELDMAPDKVLMVFLNKHLDAIKNRVAKGPGTKMSETIYERIDDAMLYLALLQAMYIEQELSKS